MATVDQRAARLAPGERADVLGRIFEQLARMHRTGVYDVAPYLTNVLLGTDEIAMLDLEKSVRFARDIRGSLVASFDLLNLVNSTYAVMSRGYADPALSRYGLDSGDAARVFAAVGAYRSSKLQRYRRRAEFLVRGVLSRAWGLRRAAAWGVPDPTASRSM